jgi:hypothetical protein
MCAVFQKAWHVGDSFERFSSTQLDMESGVRRHGRKQNDLISAPQASLTAGEGAAAVATWNGMEMPATISDIRTRRRFAYEGMKCCSGSGTWSSFDNTTVERAIFGSGPLAQSTARTGSCDHSPSQIGGRLVTSPPSYKMHECIYMRAQFRVKMH